MRKTNLFAIYFVDIQLVILIKSAFCSVSGSTRYQVSAGHYEAERLPGELEIAGIGILARHLERASLKALLV